MKQFYYNQQLIFLVKLYKIKFNKKLIENLLQNHQFEYKPLQNAVSLPIIRRIYIKMRLGISFKDIQCEKNLLVDGHHRYICSILANKEIGIRPYKAPHSAIIYDWNNLNIEDNDYDSDKIRKKHNLKDSLNYNADLQTFNKMFRS